MKNYVAVIGQGGAAYREVLAALCGEVLLLPPARGMDPRVASHPDMLMMAIGRDVAVPASYAARADVQPILNTLRQRCGIRVITTEKSPGNTYPHDVTCNGLLYGGKLYGKLSALAPEILRLADDSGIEAVNVAQGYAGCSALACGDILLTADPSVRNAVSERNGSVLSLSPGGIDLPGYDTGFIGGAGGYADGHAVFFGDVRRHPDGDRITQALSARGIVCHCLGERELTDFGGIKFFFCRADLRLSEKCGTMRIDSQREVIL